MERDKQINLMRLGSKWGHDKNKGLVGVLEAVDDFTDVYDGDGNGPFSETAGGRAARCTIRLEPTRETFVTFINVFVKQWHCVAEAPAPPPALVDAAPPDTDRAPVMLPPPVADVEPPPAVVGMTPAPKPKPTRSKRRS